MENGVKVHVCAVSVIGETTVLTSAHCLHNMDEDLWVLLGSSRLDRINEPHSKEIMIGNYVIHSKYKPGSSYYDVAIIELEETLSFDDYIRPICLPDIAFINDASWLNDKASYVAGIANVNKDNQSNISELLTQASEGLQGQIHLMN